MWGKHRCISCSLLGAKGKVNEMSSIFGELSLIKTSLDVLCEVLDISRFGCAVFIGDS